MLLECDRFTLRYRNKVSPRSPPTVLAVCFCTFLAVVVQDVSRFLTVVVGLLNESLSPLSQGNIAALMSVDTVHAKLAVNISDLNALGFAFMVRPPPPSLFAKTLDAPLSLS